jgi:hypothetical protein
MIKIIQITLSMSLLLTSCMPSHPYEVKSPCVMDDSSGNGKYGIHPCARKPMNWQYTISSI